jgi:formiminotetrahydrofolate cyclodeaminase
MTPAFLKDLARAQPDPGGGAAAAYGALLALALVEKVLGLEDRRRPLEGNPLSPWERQLARLNRLKTSLTRLQEEDVQAYQNLARARKEGVRGPQLLAPVKQAIRVPREIMARAREGLEAVAWAGQCCRKHLVSDLEVAAEFLAAAFFGAHHIARANLPLVAENALRRQLADDLAQTAAQALETLARTRTELAARGGRLE